MKNKKIVILIILFIVLIIGCLLFSVFMNNKSYNIENIKTELINNYSDLRELDVYDVSMYFGIDLNDIPSSLFLTDFVEDSENHNPFLPKQLIIVINSNKIDEYYNILQGYLEINKSSLEDIKDIKRFDSTIIKRDKNRLYLILGNNKKDIEKIIMES